MPKRMLIRRECKGRKGQMDEKPDMVICDQANYEKTKAGKKTIQRRPEFAAEMFPKLQADFPKELGGVTLEQFIRDCPYKIEFVANE